MKSKLFYGLVGLAAFFIVLQHGQALAYSVWEWWEDRDYEYTPTYSEVAAPDAVERPVQKIRPDVSGTDVKRHKSKNGDLSDRQYLIIPTRLQQAQGRVDVGYADEIIVTAQKRSSLPKGVRLPKRSDRPVDDNGAITIKTRHAVQRSCQGDTYTNLLLHDRVAKTTKPIFTAPLSVVGHQLITRDGKASHILAYTAILDTNQDDKLTCQDFIRMAIYDIKADSLHWVDMGRAEPLTINHNYNQTKANLLRPISETDYVMGIGIDENEDGLFNPQTEIIEMAVLKVDEKAFEKIVTAADLAKVQVILYGEVAE